MPVGVVSTRVCLCGQNCLCGRSNEAILEIAEAIGGNASLVSANLKDNTKSDDLELVDAIKDLVSSRRPTLKLEV